MRYLTRQLPRPKRDDEGDMAYRLDVMNSCRLYWGLTNADTMEDAARDAAKSGGILNSESDFVRYVEVSPNLDGSESVVFRVESVANVTVERVG